MDLITAVSQMQQILGFRTDLVENCKTALASVQREMEGSNRTLPNFLILEDQAISILAAAQDVALPDLFLREVEGEGPNYTGDLGYVYLRKLTKSEAKSFYFDTDPGPPAAYVRTNTTLRFYPVPDIAYTVYWDYYASSAFPETNTETNLWLTNWPELLIGKATMQIAADIQNQVAYGRAKELYELWNTKWMAYLAADEDANMPRAMGLNN